MCNGSPRRKKEYGGTEEIRKNNQEFSKFHDRHKSRGPRNSEEKNKAKKYIKSFHLQTAKNKRENLKGKQRDKHITGR